MAKRNAIRLGYDPHSAESVAYTVKRYGAIKEETLKELVEYLESPKGKAERTYELNWKSISDLDSEDGILTFAEIKTTRKGSVLYKIIDNEHDAQNTLANIRMTDEEFAKNKQGN